MKEQHSGILLHCEAKQSCYGALICSFKVAFLLWRAQNTVKNCSRATKTVTLSSVSLWYVYWRITVSFSIPVRGDCWQS